jgi:mono/diheme cytochrome c family protein
VHLRNIVGAALSVVLGLALWFVGSLGQATRVQAAPAQAAAQPAIQAPAQKPPQKDEHQRSYEIFTYSTSAKSGPQRGEELYYIKCWFCHNQYAKTGPQLKELYKRGTFTMSGDSITDQAIADKIRKGGPAMPSYVNTIKDADIQDLVSYIKSDKCCFDAENPPPNPRYRGASK